MSKLTRQQRQELKTLVANAVIRRLTGKETCAFIFEKLGVLITEDYVRRLRMDIKHDYVKDLQLLQKDREYYLEQLFFERVEELKYQQRVLHEVIDNNKQSNPDVVVRAVNVLHNITSSIYQEYTNLPILSRFRFTPATSPIPSDPEPLPSPLNPSYPHPTEMNKEPVF